MSSLEKALIEYADTFGENFPVFCLLGVADDDVILIVEKCISTGKKYVVTGDDDY